MSERTTRRQERIRAVLKRRQPDLTLVLDNIHDPHNMSAILRSCDAFAVPAVYLYYTGQNFPAPGKKSSASARKWVEMRKYKSLQPLIEDLRASSFQILGTGFSQDAQPIHAWDLTRPTAVVLGNEHQGLSPELQDCLDAELYIPMQGMVPSLNVSVAAAIILYESFRQRLELKGSAQGGFDCQALEQMFENWCKK